MKRSIPKRSRCPTLKSPRSTSSATLSMATGTTRSHLGEELIDLFIYGQLLRFSSTFRPSTIEVHASTLMVTAQTKTIEALGSVDNWGSKGRGPWQVRGSASVNNSLGQLESLSATYVTTTPHTDELRYAEAS